MDKTLTKILLVFTAMMLLIACSLGGEQGEILKQVRDVVESNATPTPLPPAVAKEQQTGVVKLTGNFTYTNDIITTYYVEHAVALVDMYGFITRNRDWEIPVNSQVLGYLKMDTEHKKGTYEIELPILPEGHLADVDNNGKKDRGVEVFTVAYWPNLTGGPYSVGDDRSYGWPTYLTSSIADSENHDEIIGGKLVVWAPDGNQKFPTDFGADGKLFTPDDPTAPIPAGYTVVDLDSHPFRFLRSPSQSLTLYEPKAAAIKDFSNKSYTKSFDDMFSFARLRYAFNGIPGKQPDWDALYKRIKPEVEEAEADANSTEYGMALLHFIWSFKDGHVGMRFTPELYRRYLKATEGGYGFAIRRMDNGQYLVVYVLPNGPAAQAGMERGAIVTAFNGMPIEQAVEKVQPWTAPFSTDWELRYEQARFLLRARPGTEASVTFTNPGGQPQTRVLTAIAERQSFLYTSFYHDAPQRVYLPVDFWVMDSGVGYIRLNSNYDDLNLIVRLFERALKTFKKQDVPGIIIDMRYNSGGAPLGLAGFFTDKTITLGQLEYYSTKTGKFEPEGEPEKFLPNEHRYHFDKIAVLVGPACYSACELEAYGFSKVPGAVVVGQYPTAGTEAEVSRGQFKLPDRIELQIPTGRFVLPDGSLFLEGKGVQPTLKVPLNRETLLSDEDVVLKTAEKVILGR